MAVVQSKAGSFVLLLRGGSGRPGDPSTLPSGLLVTAGAGWREMVVCPMLIAVLVMVSPHPLPPLWTPLTGLLLEWA